MNMGEKKLRNTQNVTKAWLKNKIGVRIFVAWQSHLTVKVLNKRKINFLKTTQGSSKFIISTE